MKAWKWLSAGVLTVAVVASVSTAFAGTSIIDGDPAPEPYSFMASLQKDGKHHCGGALIDPLWVVTAAHCGTPDVVRIGSLTTAGGGEQFTVAQRVAEPQWPDPKDFDDRAALARAMAGHDLALLRLNAPATSAPIGLDDSARPGDAVRMLGWGVRCQQSDDPQCPDDNLSPSLQQLDTTIAEPSACAPSVNLDPDREWCVEPGAGGGQACHGDSGGPLIVWRYSGWMLLGATSRDGDESAVCRGGPGVWSSIPAHRSWIDEVISNAR